MHYHYRRHHAWLTVALLLTGIIILIVVAQRYGWLSNLSQHITRDQPGLYSVNHFIDGDTIAVNMNGRVESVRLIGVDTPETHKPNTPVQCYGVAAAAFTKSTVGNNRLRLVSDSLSTNRDRYNRLLRYVYLPDGRDLDEVLIQKGYGFYYPYFPFSKSGRFAEDERQAQQQKLGLWGNCQPTPTDGGGYVSNPSV